MTFRLGASGKAECEVLGLEMELAYAKEVRVSADILADGGEPLFS